MFIFMKKMKIQKKKKHVKENWKIKKALLTHMSSW